MGQDRAVIDVRSRWKMEHIPEAEGDAFETAVSWDGREPGIRQSSCMRRQAAPMVRLTRISRGHRMRRDMELVLGSADELGRGRPELLGEHLMTMTSALQWPTESARRCAYPLIRHPVPWLELIASICNGGMSRSIGVGEAQIRGPGNFARICRGPGKFARSGRGRI